ncbi:flagellar hook-associated protein 3 FlgL [Rhodoblastus acidophilus]|uniref:flagellar hook-associated family protein n=1 Tax=Rhodoblastus acidophilus TaxID=1074 RepID=UPI00222546FD|nr:flagellar hook-associated family protein [Rhodoblastus acidophilus]MCW2284649.1 flagellar hook-associated protein 3 FlgL [Rhodoblastus acidophilus]MCW2333602.1 flagellar hook-associated protein 3 FlgL [Rhodoblastus acidophilus]
MTVNSVSSATLANILASSVTRMQSQMTVLEVENSTGRLADIGLSLGAGSGAVVALHQQVADLDALTQSNALVSTHLDTALSALGNLQQVASTALAQSVNATSVQPSTTGSYALQKAAQGALDSFTTSANSDAGGVYAFGGQNTDTAPMKSYTDSAQASVRAAFQATFGFSVNDPQVSTITATDMTNFLNGPFANLFTGANWSQDWSSASATPLTNRISTSQTVTTSITANDPAFQNTAKGLVMFAEFGNLALNQTTYSALVSAAQKTLNTGNNQLIEANAALGTMQNTLKQANSSISLQQDVLTTQINAKETVDPYLVGTQVNALSNQLQVAFSLTAQLHKLSLVNFL